MKKIILILITSLAINSMAQNLQQITYFDNNQELNGLITSKSEKNKPAVLILPAWMGIDNEAKTAALNLSEKGYLSMIADIYGKGNIPTNVDEARKLTNFYKTDYKAYQYRIQLALETLIENGANPNKIVIIGYCFGGTGALEAARGNLKVNGVVSIHGSLTNGLDRNNKIIPQILIEHGANDDLVSSEDISNLITEMNQTNAIWQMNYYGNSKHTFTNPESKDYNEITSKRSWIDTVNFIEVLLK